MIRIVAVGKIKNKAYEEACQEYLKRLSKYARVEMVVVKDKGVESEGETILNRCEGSFLIALSPEGVEMSSFEFSRFLQRSQEKKVTFAIGSEHSLSQEVLTKANLVFSLSRMTLPHELCRVVFLEQLYRAFTILKGMKYHK